MSSSGCRVLLKSGGVGRFSAALRHLTSRLSTCHLSLLRACLGLPSSGEGAGQLALALGDTQAEDANWQAGQGVGPSDQGVEKAGQHEGGVGQDAATPTGSVEWGLWAIVPVLQGLLVALETGAGPRVAQAMASVSTSLANTVTDVLCCLATHTPGQAGWEGWVLGPTQPRCSEGEVQQGDRTGGGQEWDKGDTGARLAARSAAVCCGLQVLESIIGRPHSFSMSNCLVSEGRKPWLLGFGQWGIILLLHGERR